MANTNLINILNGGVDTLQGFVLPQVTQGWSEDEKALLNSGVDSAQVLVIVFLDDENNKEQLLAVAAILIKAAGDHHVGDEEPTGLAKVIHGMIDAFQSFAVPEITKDWEDEEEKQLLNDGIDAGQNVLTIFCDSDPDNKGQLLGLAGTLTEALAEADI